MGVAQPLNEAATVKKPMTRGEAILAAWEKECDEWDEAMTAWKAKYGKPRPSIYITAEQHAPRLLEWSSKVEDGETCEPGPKLMEVEGCTNSFGGDTKLR